MKSRGVQFGFKTSIIALFVGIVLVIGLTLVYLILSGSAPSRIRGQQVHR